MRFIEMFIRRTAFRPFSLSPVLNDEGAEYIYSSKLSLLENQ